MSIPKLLAALLIPTYAVLIAVFDTLQPQGVFEPPLLLFVLNTLFLGIVPIAVAFIAGRAYLMTGSSSLLFMGCGMLTFGLCTIPAGWVIGMPGGSNMTVTIHNTGALVGAFFQVLGSITNLAGRTSPDQSGKAKRVIETAYGCVCISTVIFVFATVKGLVPSFFIQNVGPTVLRQAVLAAAFVLFVFSSGLLMHTYARWRSDFLYWYSVGMALIATGLGAVFLQAAVGSPIGWLGRSAQYVGGVFSLVAIVTAWRGAISKGLPIERVIANFLADAEASYRDLVETARDAIVSFDREGRIIGWNSSAEEMFAYPKGDAVGSPFFELLISQPYLSVLKKEIQQVESHPKKLLSGRQVQVEGRRKDGSTFPMEVSVSVRNLPTGRVTTCIIRDVTERKRADENLRASEKAYRTLSENIPGIVYRVHLDEPVRMEFFNNMVHAITGFTENELRVGEVCSIDPLILPEDKERVVNIVKEAVRGNAPFEAEYRITDKWGEIKHFIEYGRPILGGEGSSSYIDGVILDITERKQAGELLRESEQRLGQIINFLPDATLATDRDGKVIAWNRAIEEMTGVPSEAMIGKGNYEYALPFYGTRRPILLDLVLTPNEEIRQRYSVFKDGKDVLTVEADNATPLGRKVVLWAKAAPLYDAHGAVIGAIETIRDITDRKRAEEKIRRQGTLLGSINSVLREALESETDADIGRTCLRVAEEATGSRFGFIGEVNEAGRMDTIAISDPGWSACQIPGSDSVRLINNMEIRGIPGSVVKGGQSVIANDPASHPAWEGIPDGHPPLTSFMGIPLKRLDKTVGLIALANKELGYDPSDVADVEALSAVFVEALDRRRTERALHESEENFRLAFENANIGVCIVDLQGRFLRVNNRMCEMLGYSKTELESRTVNDITHPEDLDLSPRFIESAVAGRVDKTELEKRYIHKQGHVVWGSLSSSIIRDGQGNPLYFISHVRDITEQKLAEEALRASEEQNRFLAEVIGNASQPFAVGYPDGRLGFVNRAFCELTGYSEEELRQIDWNKTLTPPEWRESETRYLAELVRTGTPVR